MAPRPAWKGYLKLSLVTCAVELTNVVTHTEKVSFRVRPVGLCSCAHGNFAGLAGIETEPRPSDIQTKHM